MKKLMTILLSAGFSLGALPTFAQNYTQFPNQGQTNYSNQGQTNYSTQGYSNYSSSQPNSASNQGYSTYSTQPNTSSNQVNSTYSTQPAPSTNPGYSTYSNQNTGSNQINWVTTFAEAASQSQATSKPILILFTGTYWCPACMKLERDVLKKPEFAQTVGNQFVFLRADLPSTIEEINRSPYKPLIDRYQIQTYPTIIVADANGQRMFTVNYQQGGALQTYTQQLTSGLQQMQQSRGMYSR